MKLNIGCGRNPLPGFVNVDLYPVEGVRFGDLNGRLDFDDASVEHIQVHHVLEHVRDLDHSMREMHRILVPGGTLEARMPYGLKSLYIPYHLRPFNEHSFDSWLGGGGGCAQAPDSVLFEALVIRRQRAPPLKWHLRTYAPRLLRVLDPHDARGDELYVLLRKR